jgi:hypothetical protein
MINVQAREPEQLATWEGVLAGAVLMPVIAWAAVERDRILGVVERVWCAPTGCAEAGLALTGWAFFGVPLVAAALVALLTPPARAGQWTLVAGVVFIGVGAVCFYGARNAPWTLPPEMMSLLRGTSFGLFALILGPFVVGPLAGGALSERAREQLTARTGPLEVVIYMAVAEVVAAVALVVLVLV